MSSTSKDRDGNALVPGALYVTFTVTTDDRSGERHDRDGVFLYWTGGQFVTEDGDDSDHVEFDYVVRQVGEVNPDMIEPAVSSLDMHA